MGDPRPPLLNIPSPVEDLTARQVAERIEVAWSWPALTTEGMAARQIGGFTLWAVDVPGFQRELTPETIGAYRREVMAVAADDLASKGPGDRLEFLLPLSEWELDQLAVLAVTARNPAGRHAGYSNQVRLHPLPPPAALQWGLVEAVRDGVALSWESAERAEEYAIERARGDGDFEALGRIQLTSFLDRTVLWGETYRYRLQPLGRSQAGWIAGAMSSVATVEAVDRFAPSPPRELRGVRARESVELSWLPSPDEDTAGYLVYRDGEAISAPVPDTTYSDASAPSDGPLAYSVSAVDFNGNESERGQGIVLPARDRGPD